MGSRTFPWVSRWAWRLQGIIAMFPAANGFCFLPATPNLLAAVFIDRTAQPELQACFQSGTSGKAGGLKDLNRSKRFEELRRS